MIKHILIELSIGLTIMILVPAVLIAGFAIESKQREKDTEWAGYIGYLVDFTGCVNRDDGEWFAYNAGNCCGCI